MIIGIVICLVVTLVLHWLAPAWWWIMVVPFLWCLWRESRGGRGFLIGMLSAGLLWLGSSAFYLTGSGELIAPRAAALL